MRIISASLALAGGAAVAAAVVAILAEILLRSAFNYSLGGVDELGGYALAVGASLSMGYALIEKSHVRVDTVYMFAGQRLRCILDLIAMAGVVSIALTLAFHATTVWQFAVEFNSRSMSPMQTPLWIPQGLWVLGLWWLAVVAVMLLAILLVLVIRGELSEASRIAGIGSVDEEVKAELEDMQARAAGTERSQSTS